MNPHSPDMKTRKRGYATSDYITSSQVNKIYQQQMNEYAQQQRKQDYLQEIDKIYAQQTK
jgi:hypothetical protein